MEDLSSFLELSLDRDLYSPKLKLGSSKRPLTVLITEANTNMAKRLMYKICSGEVFGPDQEVIIHLTCSRGKKNFESITAKLYLCAFPVLLDVVASNDPKKIFKDVDVVVAISSFETFLETSNETSFSIQVSLTLDIVSRVRNPGRIQRTTAEQCLVCYSRSLFLQAKNMAKYSKKNSKLVLCGPSTKGCIILLNVLRRANLKLRFENLSSVTVLDETIAKNMIAAKLKISTTHIKNVVIWGATHADISNATALMYPPEDEGLYKKVQIPVQQALQDDNWIQSDFMRSIHSRTISADLVFQGAAVASAAATHLRLLFLGSQIHEEIFSMGVIIPPNKPYGFNRWAAVSLPVTTENGRITVKENVPLQVCNYLMNLKDEFNLTFDKINESYKRDKKKKKGFINITSLLESRDAQKIKLKYLLCTLPGDKNFQAHDSSWLDSKMDFHGNLPHKINTKLKFRIVN